MYVVVTIVAESVPIHISLQEIIYIYIRHFIKVGFKTDLKSQI